jgi:DNA-binding GntR family transcriptional regulator
MPRPQHRPMPTKHHTIDIAIDRAGPVPLYFQVLQELEWAIADGRIERGAFLENEIALAERWQLSRPTVRRAIQELVDQGLLVRQRGVGTQVVNDEIRKAGQVSSLHDELLASGQAPSTIVLAFETMIGDASKTDALGLPRGSMVLYVERCRLANGRRLALMRNWVLPSAAGNLTADDLNCGGLYSLFRVKGFWPHYSSQRIGARNASPVDAALLGLPIGAAVLTVQSVMQDKTGSRIDCCEMVSDAASYSRELTVIEG